MAMDFTNLKPNVVSRDLSGYITYIYGAPKVGKTTLASQMDKAILLALEPGYHAIPGIQYQDITNWSDVRQAVKELKRPAVKELFSCVIVDTIDIGAEYCKKYICNQNDISDLGELGYGKGWTKFKDEFTDTFRSLTQLGYAVFFIGHDKEIIDEDGNKTIRPALSNSVKTVVSGLADIYGYAHQKHKGEMSVLTLRDTSGAIECGGRFKYIEEEIPLNYQALVNAVKTAIDKEAEEHGNMYVTDERVAPVLSKSYDFNQMMEEISNVIGQLMEKSESNASKITSVVEHYLGKGKKVGECTPMQVEQLDLILIDLKELLQ